MCTIQPAPSHCQHIRDLWIAKCGMASLRRMNHNARIYFGNILLGFAKYALPRSIQRRSELHLRPILSGMILPSCHVQHALDWYVATS